MSLKAFHLSVFALNSYTLWYDQTYVDLPFPSKDLEQFPLKARHLFLTVWCLVIQTVYFAVSFLNDVSGTNAVAPRNPPIIRRLKDVLFSLAFPVAIYVSLVFWGLYMTHKELIFPHEIEIRIPVWVNHVMHTLIVPFVFIELLVTKRKYPSRKFGMNMVVAFISVYILWVLAVYMKTNVWAYPFLDRLNWPLRAVFCIVSTLGGLAIYVLGEKINYAVSPSAKVYKNGVNSKKN